MSESVSSRTKSLSESDDTISTESPVVPSRWSNNITYRQLVMSSCIGILQVCWHPYVHDLRRLLPFLFLYNVATVVVAYPLFYLELALGVVTRKGVLNCWDLAPAVRGVGFTMLLTSVFTALATGAMCAYTLALFVHSFHTFLPWLYCASTARPACTARNRAMAAGSDTPAQSFFFNFVLDLRRQGLDGGLGDVVWELTVYYVISWLLIYFVAFKRIYSYSKLVLFKDVLTYFVLLSCAVGVTQLEGAKRIFQQSDWSTIFEDGRMWREAIDYSLMEMSVSTGTLIMLGAHCPKDKEGFSNTALITLSISKLTTMASAMVLGATHGALSLDYDNSTNIWSGASSSLVLWADLVARIPGSHFWSAIVFFTLFVLAVTSTALLVLTIISSLTGKSIRKAAWAFLILACTLYIGVGAVTLCTQGGLYIVNSSLMWLGSRCRAVTGAAAAAALTCGYGQPTFCEDVYFAKGEYPGVLLRVAWALLPVVLLISFIGGMGFTPPADTPISWTLVLLSLLPILVLSSFYPIFKCRVRNIVGTEK